MIHWWALVLGLHHFLPAKGSIMMGSVSVLFISVSLAPGQGLAHINHSENVCWINRKEQEDKCYHITPFFSCRTEWSKVYILCIYFPCFSSFSKNLQWGVYMWGDKLFTALEAGKRSKFKGLLKYNKQKYFVTKVSKSFLRKAINFMINSMILKFCFLCEFVVIILHIGANE
jgi:hypothetical protein